MTERAPDHRPPAPPPPQHRVHERARRPIGHWLGMAFAALAVLAVIAQLAGSGETPQPGGQAIQAFADVPDDGTESTTSSVVTTSPAERSSSTSVTTTADPTITASSTTTTAPRTTTTAPSTTTTEPTTTEPTTSTTVSTTTTAPATTTTTAPPTTSTTSSGGCHPNYTPCVPIASDVDCAGGSGNGPEYVHGPIQVIGQDVYRLDGDNDGVGCES